MHGDVIILSLGLQKHIENIFAQMWRFSRACIKNKIYALLQTEPHIKPLNSWEIIIIFGNTHTHTHIRNAQYTDIIVNAAT